MVRKFSGIEPGKMPQSLVTLHIKGIKRTTLAPQEYWPETDIF